MLEEALELARNNPVDDLPKMAAIISKRKRIISTGLNSRKSHPLMAKFTNHPAKVFIHAEIAAINNALKVMKPEQLKGAEIFIARILKNGSRAVAKPCSVCQKALDSYGISSVTWTEYE